MTLHRSVPSSPRPLGRGLPLPLPPPRGPNIGVPNSLTSSETVFVTLMARSTATFAVELRCRLILEPIWKRLGLDLGPLWGSKIERSGLQDRVLRGPVAQMLVSQNHRKTNCFSTFLACLGIPKRLQTSNKLFQNGFPNHFNLG